jgi:hypothetical protein
MQDPFSVKDVQKLTGRVVALNTFIPREAERSLPFFQVLRSSKNFQWSKTQKQAFQELKDYLSNMTKLCPPKPRSQLLLYVCVMPKFLINPNRRSTRLTVVKSRSTWVLTPKNSPTNSKDTFDLVDTHVGPTHGQRLCQTPLKP